MDEQALANESDYKKQREQRNKKIKQLYKDNPDNEIIKEMYDEIEDEERRMDRKGPSPFSYIHEAVWAAERAYNEGTISYRKACNDLMESIDMFSKIVDEKKKGSTKGDDYE